MKLFFGRINKEQDPKDQLDAGYYFSPKGSSYYGDLANVTDFTKESTYVYMIGGKKIQLWKAREWSRNNDRLLFDIIMPNVQGLSTLNIAAFKYFNINLDLIIFPVRQSRGKAFYAIQGDAKFTEGMLLDAAQYKDENNYRKIEVQAATPKAATLNLVLYRENGLLKFNTPSLFDPEISKTFVDNTVHVGKGRKRKDNVLKQIAGVKNPPAVFSFNQLRILPFYDAYFVDYDTDVDEDEELIIELPKTNYNFMKIDTKNIHINQILYGPPGTGKTYNTVNIALRIAVPNEYEKVLASYTDTKQQRKEVVKLFNEQQILAKDDAEWESTYRQIAFTTFHQSFSYEDFIEGIKPESVDNQVQYNIKDGVFKRMCALAQREYDKSKRNQPASSDIEIPAKAAFFKILLTDAEYKKCIEEEIIGINGSVEKRLYDIFKGHLKINEAVILATTDNHHIRGIAVLSDPINEGTDPIFKSKGKVKWLDIEANIPRENLYSKPFKNEVVQGLDEEKVKLEIMRHLKAKPLPTPLKKYVLIIDEINRGNVSQIFGELITLIEKDKRLGEMNQITVTLPYSKTPFSVPPNLYLIGTMNTADRSVEALDTALRRRFAFQEMPPNYDRIEPQMVSINGKNFDLQEILKRINYRIEKLVNRDHLIGHSYFIGINSADDLRVALANGIIPLLQEYFYGDYAKMCLVMGEGFVDINPDLSNENQKDFFADIRHDAYSDFMEKQVWAIKDVCDTVTMTDEIFSEALTILLKGKKA